MGLGPFVQLAAPPPELDVLLVALNVPESPFVQPPAGAWYVPVIEFPSADAVPVNETVCVPSNNDTVTFKPLTLPLSVPETAQGEPLIFMVPENCPPVWFIAPQRNVLYPKFEIVLACQFPARLMGCAF